MMPTDKTLSRLMKAAELVKVLLIVLFGLFLLLIILLATALLPVNVTNFLVAGVILFGVPASFLYKRLQARIVIREKELEEAEKQKKLEEQKEV